MFQNKLCTYSNCSGRIWSVPQAAACEKGRWAAEIRPHTLNRAPAPGGQTVWEQIDSVTVTGLTYISARSTVDEDKKRWDVRRKRPRLLPFASACLSPVLAHHFADFLSAFPNPYE